MTIPNKPRYRPEFRPICLKCGAVMDRTTFELGETDQCPNPQCHNTVDRPVGAYIPPIKGASVQ